ncbi:hypothetical protein CC1G_05645 [Coprinopsis cinerea okayama7|uniref:DUF6533 domain-containing protein n=1 Tax=Coprinopsis cinerea (strain Okayama-7 / 130 / ATCC MYA-4618 / FGSC 9003) TaxID=240176 RepID=A8P1S2_COPC7|nr:hypothetical protein CC1G_05645 [Coprinopsis cinerea okayama7\|eukprot:XP_001838164.2 hypothetical protein CC1G_05645 [Coprinopsis cinerea okayama7\
MASLEEKWQLLLNYLNTTQIAHYSKVAALTFVICDICRTLEIEVKYLWTGKWKLGRIAYMIARYWAVFYLIVFIIVGTKPRKVEWDSSCRKYSAFAYYGGYIVYSTVGNVISILRVTALYNRSMIIMWFFTILACIEFALEFYATWRILDYLHKGAFNPPFPFMTGCHTNAAGSNFLNITLMAWVTWTVVAFLFFVFTLAQFRRSVALTTPDGKKESLWKLLADKNNYPSLMTIVVRDGSLHFFIILVAMVVQMATVIYRGGYYFPLMQPLLMHVFEIDPQLNNFSVHARRSGVEHQPPPSVPNIMSMSDYLYYCDDDLRRALLVRNYEMTMIAVQQIAEDFTSDEDEYSSEDEYSDTGTSQIEASKTQGCLLDDASFQARKEDKINHLLPSDGEPAEISVFQTERPLNDGCENKHATISVSDSDPPENHDVSSDGDSKVQYRVINSARVVTDGTSDDAKKDEIDFRVEIKVATDTNTLSEAREGKRKAVFEDGDAKVPSDTTIPSKRLRTAGKENDGSSTTPQ